MSDLFVEILYTIFNRHEEDLVLKGINALTFYGSDVETNIIELDTTSTDIEDTLKKYCEEEGFTFKTIRDSKPFKQYTVEDLQGNALTVEVSTRFPPIRYGNEYSSKIKIYSLEELLQQGINSFLSKRKPKLLQLYQIVFICMDTEVVKTYENESRLYDMFIHEGLEYINLILNNTSDKHLTAEDVENIKLGVSIIYKDLYRSE